jgi:lysophospholipid acyltransferase (LPLAT)-like uncharacterized protein
MQGQAPFQRRKASETAGVPVPTLPSREGALSLGAALASWPAAGVLALLRRTQRLRFHDDEEIRRRERRGPPFILAFWHRHLLLMRWGYRGGPMTVLISQSRDGELVARTIERLGIRTARGSSSRGGALGMRGLLQAAKAGGNIAFTPDGPRGPRGVVQPGVVAAAAMTGLDIIPAALAATRARRVGSWDRMPVPLPFGVVHYVYGEPLGVARGADLELAGAELKRRLDAAEAKAARLAGSAA